MALESDNNEAPKNRQVVWIQNKHGNTGEGGGLAELVVAIARLKEPSDSNGVLVQRPSSRAALQKYVQEKGWVPYSCPLTNFLLGEKDSVVVWAAPLDRAKEHRGKNNVIATYLTAELDGLALGTICGRALIAAADGVDMDVTFEKVQKLVAISNDMLNFWGCEDPAEEKRMMQNAKRLLPFYNTGDGVDTFHFDSIHRILREPSSDDLASNYFSLCDADDMKRLRELAGDRAWPST